jgi:hypothetical protein
LHHGYSCNLPKLALEALLWFLMFHVVGCSCNYILCFVFHVNVGTHCVNIKLTQDGIVKINIKLAMKLHVWHVLFDKFRWWGIDTKVHYIYERTCLFFMLEEHFANLVCIGSSNFSKGMTNFGLWACLSSNIVG